MNGITINDKQYIFTTESDDCKDCAFYEKDYCGIVCHAMKELSFSYNGGKDGVFKELKIEK